MLKIDDSNRVVKVAVLAGASLSTLLLVRFAIEKVRSRTKAGGSQHKPSDDLIEVLRQLQDGPFRFGGCVTHRGITTSLAGSGLHNQHPHSQNNYEVSPTTSMGFPDVAPDYSGADVATIVTTASPNPSTSMHTGFFPEDTMAELDTGTTAGQAIFDASSSSSSSSSTSASASANSQEQRVEAFARWAGSSTTSSTAAARFILALAPAAKSQEWVYETPLSTKGGDSATARSKKTRLMTWTRKCTSSFCRALRRYLRASGRFFLRCLRFCRLGCYSLCMRGRSLLVSMVATVRCWIYGDPLDEESIARTTQDLLLAMQRMPGVSADIERILAPMKPTPGRTPTVAVLRVPPGYDASVDAHSLWQSLQVDGTVQDDALIDVVIMTEDVPVAEAAVPNYLSRSSISDSCSSSTSNSTTPHNNPTGGGGSSNAQQQLLVFEVYSAYSFYAHIFRCCVMQEKDKLSLELVNDNMAENLSTASCSQKGCACHHRPNNHHNHHHFLDPNSPLVESQHSGFSCRKQSNPPNFLERVSKRVGSLCLKTPTLSYTIASAVGSPLSLQGNWNTGGFSAPDMQFTVHTAAPYNPFRRQTQSSAIFFPSLGIGSPTTATTANNSERAPSASFNLSDVKTLQLKERYRLSFYHHCQRSIDAVQQMDTVLEHIRTQWGKVFRHVQVEYTVNDTVGETIIKKLRPWIIQGVVRRENLRDHIMGELLTRSFRICTIPLQDCRVYRQTPPAVPRYIAAHARGFPLAKTYAEEILTQQHVLQTILVSMEQKERVSQARRQYRRWQRHEQRVRREEQGKTHVQRVARWLWRCVRPQQHQQHQSESWSRSASELQHHLSGSLNNNRQVTGRTTVPSCFDSSHSAITGNSANYTPLTDAGVGMGSLSRDLVGPSESPRVEGAASADRSMASAPRVSALLPKRDTSPQQQQAPQQSGGGGMRRSASSAQCLSDPRYQTEESYFFSRGEQASSMPSNVQNSASSTHYGATATDGGVGTGRWTATNTSTNFNTHANAVGSTKLMTSPRQLLHPRSSHNGSTAAGAAGGSGTPVVSGGSTTYYCQVPSGNTSADASVTIPRTGSTMGDSCTSHVLFAPNSSMYGTFDAYFGHTVVAPQAVLARQQQQQQAAARLNKNNTTAAAAGGAFESFVGGGAPMMYPPLGGRGGSYNSLDTFSGLSNGAQYGGGIHANFNTNMHIPLRQYNDTLLDLLGSAGGPMSSGITYYYTFGDASACLFNASVQSKPEVSGWESSTDVAKQNEAASPSAFASAGSRGDMPPHLPSPAPPHSESDGGGSSYMFSHQDPLEEEAEREEKRQVQARQERNAPFGSVFKHLHEMFFRTMLRDPAIPTPIGSAFAGGGTGTASSRLNQSGSPKMRERVQRRSTFFTSLLAGALQRPVSPPTAAKSRGGGGGGSRAAAATTAAGSGDEKNNCENDDDDNTVAFAGTTRCRDELDVQNGHHGLTPFEVWLATRYSRRSAGEVYVMDVHAAKGDPFYPAVRVIDEVVAHAVLYYHNRSLRDFLEDLEKEFGLHYEPKTRWARVYMGYPVPDEVEEEKKIWGVPGRFPATKSSSSRPHYLHPAEQHREHSVQTEAGDQSLATLTQEGRALTPWGPTRELASSTMLTTANSAMDADASESLIELEPSGIFDNDDDDDIHHHHHHHHLDHDAIHPAELNKSNQQFDTATGDEEVATALAMSSPSLRTTGGDDDYGETDADRHHNEPKHDQPTCTSSPACEEDPMESIAFLAHAVGTEEDRAVFDSLVSLNAVDRRGGAEAMLLQELEHVKDFLIEHRHVLSSAMLTVAGSNRLEGVFGAPATVFPFLLCGRESISLVSTLFDALEQHYGTLVFENFAKFTHDVFSRDRPEVIRHAPRIFRKINKSRRGYISYEEMCSWMARRLSCGANIKPDAHLLATSMSLRLPMSLLLNKKSLWPRLQCTLRSISDGESEY